MIVVNPQCIVWNVERKLLMLNVYIKYVQKSSINKYENWVKILDLSFRDLVAICLV